MSRQQKQQPTGLESPAAPKRGEIWWVKQNPIIPNDPHLPRPVVVISTNARNRNWSSIVVVPFSTSLENIYTPWHKFVPKAAGGLDKDSHARCDLVSNIDKNCLDSSGPLGPPLSDQLMWQIVKGVRAVIGDNPD